MVMFYKNYLDDSFADKRKKLRDRKVKDSKNAC